MTIEGLTAELRKARADLPNVGPLGQRDQLAYIGVLERRLREARLAESDKDGGS